jgi:hypothetical protein
LRCCFFPAVGVPAVPHPSVRKGFWFLFFPAARALTAASRPSRLLPPSPRLLSDSSERNQKKSHQNKKTQLFLQGERQVPVEQSDVRFQARCLTRVQQAVVEGDAFRVGFRPSSFRKQAGPGQGEAKGGRAERGRGCQVGREAVVEVVGDVARVAAVDVTGGVREGVPDGGAPAAGVDGALDLVGRRRRAEEEWWRVGVGGWMSAGVFFVEGRSGRGHAHQRQHHHHQGAWRV